MDMAVALIPGQAGGPRGVLEASAAAAHDGECAALAVVVATEGSTYVRAGALALFGPDGGQVGWLSGGCLEPEIARRALAWASAGRLGWLDIDTRDDEALLSGSALGCRGRLRLALLPLAALPGWPALVQAWRAGDGPLQLDIAADGALSARVGAQAGEWRVATDAQPEASHADTTWRVAIAPPPAVLVLGAGPETPTLVPLLRQLGWTVTVAERRPRWVPNAGPADAHLAATPTQALRDLPMHRFDAALVMHHHFELDREALAALAATSIGFVGLLGPARRREDLFRVLPATARTALQPCLHAPVGLDLGGHGPEAIALSIAAQLHAWRPAS